MRFYQLGLIGLALTSLGLASVGPVHAQAADFTLTNGVVWGPNGAVSTNIGIPTGGVVTGKITVSNAVPGTYNWINFSAAINATGPVVSFNQPHVVLASWTSDSASTLMSIRVGQNVLHGGYLLNVTATNGVETHSITYQIKVYTIAITIDAQSNISTDQTVESSALEPKTFRVGVLVSNATSVGGTRPECTVSFPCAFQVYGWQFGLNYDPTVLLPQGDPNPLAFPGNPYGLYVGSAEGTLLLGSQSNIGKGAATWSTLYAGGNAYAVSSNKAGEIVEAYSLISPTPAAFLASPLPNTHYLLGSISFELLRKAASPTIVSLSPVDTIFANQRGQNACVCVLSTAPGEGGVAVENITNAPPIASFTVNPLPTADSSCIPVTGAVCSPYAFIIDGRPSFDPDGTAPLQYYWDFGDGSRDSPLEASERCPESTTVLECSQGAMAVHDYLVSEAADSAIITLRIADTDGTLSCTYGSACATGSAVDLSGNPLQNSQPSHSSSTTKPYPQPLPPLFTFSPTTPMTGETVLFRVNSTTTGNLGPYFWDFGDGTTGYRDHEFHVYNTPGNYTVILTTQGSVDRAIIRVVTPDPSQPGLVWTRQSGVNVGVSIEVSVGEKEIYTAGDFVSAYDLNGTQLWTARGGAGTVQSVSAGSDGVYVARGLSVEKYSLNGVMLWSKGFNFSAWANAVSSSPDGVYVAGNAYLTKLDSNGNELWTVKQSQNEFAISVGPKAVYAIGCCTENETNKFELDAKLVAFNFKGRELWTAQVGPLAGLSSAPYPMSVSAGRDGIYVSAETGRSVITGEDQGFVRKYDFQGRNKWTHQFQFEGPSAVSASSNGVYVAGETGTCLTPCASLQYFFVAYLDPMGSQVWMLRFDRGSYAHVSASVSSSPEGVFVNVSTVNLWSSVSKIAPPDPVPSENQDSELILERR